MSYTMQDFIRQIIREEFAEMTPAEREEFLQTVPLKTRLAGATPEQIQEYLDQIKTKTGARQKRSSKKK